MIHDTVIDTSVVFPHSRGPPYKKALRTLCGDILQKIIQNDGILDLRFSYFNWIKTNTFKISWRSRQCRRRYCVYGTNDVENQTRFKATQVKSLSRKQRQTYRTKEKTNVAIFLSLSSNLQIFFFLFRGVYRCRVITSLKILCIHFAAHHFQFIFFFSYLYSEFCASWNKSPSLFVFFSFLVSSSISRT